MFNASKSALRFAALGLALITALAMLCGCAALDQSIEDLAGGNDPHKEYYDKGVEAYNNGDFYSAREYFLTADGYQNSQEFLDAIDEYERIYLEGVAQFESEDYEAAMKSFTAVKKFSNAAEYVDHINGLKAYYDEGLRLYKEQDFVAARERFVQSCNYGQAASYIASIDSMEEKYQVAMGLYNENKYRAAIAAFEAIGANYKDTYDIISAIYGILEHSGVNITTYLASYKKSFEDVGESVEFVLTDVNETGFMITDSNGLLLIGNTKEDGTVTEVSFWMEEAMLENLTEDEANGLFAHCIRALDIDMMTYEDVLANMDEYTDGKATYGNFTFELDFDDAGYAVLKAKLIGEEE